MSKREFKINTPGVEPVRAVETIVEDAQEPVTGHGDGQALYSPPEIVDATPKGLPTPAEIDPTTLRRPVLTTEGWLCPENIRGGGL